MKIPNSVTRSFHRFGLQIKKHAPEILVTVGVVGTVASAVMACKATLKVNDIVDQTKADVEKIHEATENGVTEAGLEYTEEDSKKDLALVYVQTGVKFVKLYGPSILLGALSISAILASNNIHRKRNLALAAAYATVDQGFKEYRGRVVERFGKDLDKELRYNIKAQEIEKTVTDENGNEQVVKETVQVANPNIHSQYARFFDESCPAWEKNAENNLYFLLCQQSQANDILQARGHLFLNEVYDMLGMQRTVAGQSVGWVYDPNNAIGDNYVDFGIHEVTSERKRAFVNGYERCILLDFNVDGDILSLLN